MPRTVRLFFIWLISGTGTPGGRFDPEHQFWGNTVDGKRSDTLHIGSEETVNGKWSRAFFGHLQSSNIIYVAHLTSDAVNDTFSYMGASPNGVSSEDGMLAFGFGRKGGTPLMKGPHRFFIGLYDHDDPQKSLFEGLKHHIKSNVYR